MIPQIIAEVDFNRPQDRTSNNRRIVSLYASKKELHLSFEIGEEEDDAIILSFPVTEFVMKLGQALIEQEAEDKEDS